MFGCQNGYHQVPNPKTLENYLIFINGHTSVHFGRVRHYLLLLEFQLLMYEFIFVLWCTF
jgi:hypothetical protein